MPIAAYKFMLILNQFNSTYIFICICLVDLALRSLIHLSCSLTIFRGTKSLRSIISDKIFHPFCQIPPQTTSGQEAIYNFFFIILLARKRLYEDSNSVLASELNVSMY